MDARSRSYRKEPCGQKAFWTQHDDNMVPPCLKLRSYHSCLASDILADQLAHDVVGGSLGQLSVDLHRDLDPGAEQTAQVLRNLLDHGRDIAYSTRHPLSTRTKIWLFTPSPGTRTTNTSQK